MPMAIKPHGPHDIVLAVGKDDAVFLLFDLVGVRIGPHVWNRNWCAIIFGLSHFIDCIAIGAGAFGQPWIILFEQHASEAVSTFTLTPLPDAIEVGYV